MKYIYFLGLALLFSCKSEVVVETIALEDVLPQSTYTQDTSRMDVEEEAELVSEFELSLRKAIRDSSLIFSKGEFSLKYFPDRLTNVSREQELIIVDSDSILFTVWEFPDSLTTINAFYNWLDCFGENCTEMKIDEEINFSKKNVLTFVSDHHLIYLESVSSFNMNKWKNEIIPVLYPDDFWIYAIAQQAKRRGKWHTYEQ
jgi:hypothetical protein